MEISPRAVFRDRDIAAARRLNQVLAWLPRYHTGRRWNAWAINGLLRTAQALVPKGKAGNLPVEKIVLPDRPQPPSLRLVRPPQARRALLLHFHGGAWVLGNARLDDAWMAHTAKACGIAVAACDFHQAIDDDLSRTLHDAVAVLRWTLDHLDELGADVLILQGESSGAHLAAYALLQVAQHRPVDQVIGFVSFCGAFDMTGSPSLHHAKDSLLIDPPSALHNLDRLTDDLTGGQEAAAAISPLFAGLKRMPPALFLAGALDPILQDSLRMHDRWEKHAGNVELLVVPEGPHGFERLPTRLAAATKALVYLWITARLNGTDNGAPTCSSKEQPHEDVPAPALPS